jgi:hypothetical protein
LFSYVLRAGNAPATLGAIGILRRVIERLRAALPRARLLVRLDGGFASGEIFGVLAVGVREIASEGGVA